MPHTEPLPPAEEHPSVLARAGARVAAAAKRLPAGSPARLALVVFLLGIGIFTLLLALPISSSDGHWTPLHDAMFTAVSAVCVTGLTVVSTATHWSLFGQAVILLAIFVGGLGIITLASILAQAVTKRLGLRGKLIAQQSMNSSAASKLGEVGSLLRVVILTSITMQAILALWLTIRMWTLGEPFWVGLWHGVFYSISAFNNAGFTPHSDGLVPYEMDVWLLTPLMLGVFIGSMGFPVLMVLLVHRWHFRHWNLHTKLTVTVSSLLVVGGTLAWGASEWGNPKTIGSLGVGEKLMHSLFASVMTRSGGFSLVDQSQMHPATLVFTDALMFVGGGSASTAGGIKVTTLAVIFLAILAEARGTRYVQAFGRKIPESVMRVAISVTSLGATLVTAGTIALLVIDPRLSLDHVVFECISAFGTVGLSTGVSEALPPSGKYVLIALMFLGRVGTITFATALSLRHRRQLYQYPEERPIIG